MKKKDEEYRRCAIYAVTGNDEIVDGYKLKELEELKKVSKFVLTVCSSNIPEKEEKKLRKYSNFVLKLKNNSDTQSAYLNALLYLKLAPAFNFDQIVMMDDSVFGPVYPLYSVFNKMKEKREVDFWSITKRKDNFPDTYFIVLNSAILMDKYLCNDIKYCLKKPEPLTKFVNNLLKKYSYQSVLEMEDLLSLSDCPFEELPYFLLKYKKCPFINEKHFYNGYKNVFKINFHDQVNKILPFLQEETDYNVEVIWKRILRVGNMADIKNQLNLNYVLSSVETKSTSGNGQKIALILHIYYEDLAKYCRSYIENMPQDTDVYVTVPDEKKLEKVKEAFVGIEYKIEYRITGNIGRDVGPFIVGCKDIVDNYDLVCKVHDKRVYQVKPMSIGESWSYKCFENLLKNKTFVNNVIEKFKTEPFLGLMMPPAPIHGPYYPTIGFGEWGVNYEIAKKVYKSLNLHVPISEDKEPVAPLGSMFWFRTKALKPLFAHEWKYEELPKEPIPVDQTILHAIERIYPFCAQEAGFYSAWVMVDSYAKIELDNFNYMNRELQKKEFEMIGIQNFEDLLCKIKEF